jgi:hypothetical protein
MQIGQLPKACPVCYKYFAFATNTLRKIKNRCTKENLECDLDLDWMFERLQKPCSVTKLNFVFNRSKGPGNRHASSPSVDRINPYKGYTKDNCRMVVWWYNAAKQRYSDLEVWHYCHSVVESLDVNNVLFVQQKEETEVAIT